MAIRGNPTISARIDRQSRLALSAICEVDEIDVSAFVSEAVQAAICRRLARLGKRVSYGVQVADEPGNQAAA